MLPADSYHDSIGTSHLTASSTRPPADSPEASSDPSNLRSDRASGSMDPATERERPREVTSRRSIRYRSSAWSVHEFEVVGAGGETVCAAAALRTAGSLLVWVGAGCGGGGGGGEGARLAAAALSVPDAGCAALLGGEDAAAARLARRLALRLRRPVYVCCGEDFDRFTLPLVERGLVQEIKSRPDRF